MPKKNDVRSVELEYNDDGTWQISFRLKDKPSKGNSVSWQEPVKMTAINLDEAVKKIKRFIKGGKNSVSDFKKYLTE